MLTSAEKLKSAKIGHGLNWVKGRNFRELKHQNVHLFR